MTSSQGDENQGDRQHEVAAPAISLPKGGGAIRGIGEKFAANPVTGTGSMSVPIATSPGRSGFGPELSLSYDSGSGNGPFGFGWSLSLPSITRKTDKGLPQYSDSEESDVYVLSGAEDLVPVYRQDLDGTGLRLIQDRTRRRRLLGARHGGAHADSRRPDRWLLRPPLPAPDRGAFRPHRAMDQHQHRRDPLAFDHPGQRHHVYGKDNNSASSTPPTRSPAASTRIFSWLICESYDDKGNAIVYEYAAENANNVDPGQPNERNRVRTANRYLKRIKYGNRVSEPRSEDLGGIAP